MGCTQHVFVQMITFGKCMTLHFLSDYFKALGFSSLIWISILILLDCLSLNFCYRLYYLHFRLISKRSTPSSVDSKQESNPEPVTEEMAQVCFWL